MSKKWPGGIITPTPATPTGPYQNGTAGGIWTIPQADYWIKQGLWPIAGNLNPTALIAGGYNTGGTAITTTNYFLISTTGNPTSFGNLATGRGQAYGVGSTTRAIVGGGRGPSSSSGNTQFTSEYTTFASTGSYASFGDLYINRSNGGSLCNSTYGLYVAGDNSGGSPVYDTSRVTIATTGNASYFGDYSNLTDSFFGGCCSSTTGVVGAGLDDVGGSYLAIRYTTIGTSGSFTYFGDISAMPYVSACSNSTRGVFAGSSSPDTNTIRYITISTTGNATTFGQLTGVGGNRAGVASTTRAVWGGAGNGQNVMNYVEISTTGNATSFGQLITAIRNAAGVSAASGGVQ